MVVLHARDAPVEADSVQTFARAAGLEVIARCLDAPLARDALARLVREHGSVVIVASTDLVGRPDLHAAVDFALADTPPVPPELLRVLAPSRQALPPPLDQLPCSELPTVGRPGPLTLVSLVIGIVAVVAALITGRSLFLPGGLVLACLAMLGMQLVGGQRRLVLRATLLRVEAAIRTADLHDVLVMADEIHDRWFGERLLSWRALRRSAVISLSVLVLLGWAAVAIIRLNVEANPAVGLPTILLWALPKSLLFGLGLLLFNIPADFLSWTTTRGLIRWLAARPGVPLVLAGLGLDLVLMATLAAAPAVLNPGTSQLFAISEGWQVLHGAVAHWSLWLTGDLHLGTALQDWNTAAYLVVGLAAFTAVLPTLVHGALLAGALLLRLLSRWAPQGAAELVEAAARRPQGPAGLLLLLPALVVASLSARPVDLDGTFRPSPDPVPRTGTIGCLDDDSGCFDDEPQRSVRLSRDVHLAVTETTVGQWAATVQRDPTLALHYELEAWPSPYRDPEMPVTTVSWCDALRFANLLSQQHSLRPAYRINTDPTLPGCGVSATVDWDRDADGYRLPTEAEWELAARAGQDGSWAGADDPTRVAWTLENSGSRPHPVGLLPANALGLHDMAGNVWEWTWDAYQGEPPDGRDVAVTSTEPSAWRVVRGGSWVGPARVARSAFRGWDRPASRVNGVGFRLVLPSRVGGGS